MCCVVFGGEALSRPEWSFDGVHQNDQGYFKIAGAVKSAVLLIVNRGVKVCGLPQKMR